MSKICRLAEFYQSLAALVRRFSARLADALERTYQFLSRLGNCEAAEPANVRKVAALSAAADDVLGIDDIEAAYAHAEKIDTLLAA